MDMERRTMRAHSGRRAHRLVHDDAPEVEELLGQRANQEGHVGHRTRDVSQRK